ncbi:ribosomal RNA adenine dimethylase-domain-containing protein [Mycena vulgaris]|nr:ribosomal RNA adenine dimethylase-domain-containing protein [Mycena vulgaris]
MDARMSAELTKRVKGTCVSFTKAAPDRRERLRQGAAALLRRVHIQHPYKISSTVVFRLLSHQPLFRIAILMFQQEFARRLVARPGSALWSRLSANVQLYANLDHLRDVKRNTLRPALQVESSVVRLVPRDPPPPVKFEEFDGLTRVIFSRKYKTVRGIFLHSGVISMLESNWRVWCSVNEASHDHATWNSITNLIQTTPDSPPRFPAMSRGHTFVGIAIPLWNLA